MLGLRFSVVPALVLSVPAAAQLENGLYFKVTGGPPAPGSYFDVAVYARIPDDGTPVRWENGGGFTWGSMEGFSSVYFNVSASIGSWTNLALPPGMNLPPFGSAGTAQGATINAINSGVGFGPPIPGPDVYVWSGRLTLPPTPLPSELLLRTEFRTVGSPPFGPYRGIEVAVSGIIPNLNVSIFLQDLHEGSIAIPLPAPGAAPLIAAGLCLRVRRRRPARRHCVS